MNMHYILRPITASDESFLWEMLYQAIYVPPHEPPYPHDNVYLPEFSRYVQDWGKPGDSGAIAVTHNGQPIGAAWIRLLISSQGGHGYVDDTTPELTMAIFQHGEDKVWAVACWNTWWTKHKQHFLPFA